MKPPRVPRAVLPAALGLTGLALFLVLVDTPAGIAALLAVFTSVTTTAFLAAVGAHYHPSNAPHGRRAPQALAVPDRERVPVGGRVPPAPISTILNPHPDNRRRRASRAEREAVVWELELHLFDERLDDREFDTRHDYAVKAISRGDLADLLSDLSRPRHRGI